MNGQAPGILFAALPLIAGIAALAILTVAIRLQAGIALRSGTTANAATLAMTMIAVSGERRRVVGALLAFMLALDDAERVRAALAQAASSVDDLHAAIARQREFVESADGRLGAECARVLKHASLAAVAADRHSRRAFRRLVRYAGDFDRAHSALAGALLAPHGERGPRTA